MPRRYVNLDGMLPIGAYDPTWFMARQHMGPEEAGRAWEDLWMLDVGETRPLEPAAPPPARTAAKG